MSLLATIKSALGLHRPVEPTDGGPFRLTRAATRAVDALPEGRALHIDTVPVVGGYALRAFEGSDEDVPEEAEHRIAAPIVHWNRLHGIVLDHDGERYFPKTNLRVVPRETPNPDGRKYETDRFLARGSAQAFRRGQDDVPPLPARLLAIDGVRAVLFNLNTVSVEREGQADWGPIDRAVESAIHEHLLLCGPLLEPLEIVHDSDLEAEVMRVLHEELLPKVHRDGGDLQLVGVEDGVVRLRMLGACGTCPASQITLKLGAERLLKAALPGRIREVVSV